MPGWLKKLEQWIGKGADGKKRANTFRLLLILGLAGIAIMLFNSFVNVKEVDNGGEGREPPVMQDLASEAMEESAAGGEFNSIELSLENKTKEILEKIVGVGAVDVLVTIDSTEEVVVQRNVKDTQELTEESDADGGRRHVTQYTRDGQIVTYENSGSEQPIVTKKIKPKIRGVLVVARGAENKTVKGLIVDAVEKGLNVPAYRISVVPRKQSQ
ncbi:MAG: stage III sporulation protein AG [Paenibacillus macerans]|uniref:Stage III sporulation protein AG n=1 Tax=Paenibacillus macerans TaxID=44252 RepID=A0A090ZFY4_PAEMA|nr:stage III sporulation protein AG [Paenibacillus macerans]KFN09547.1 stage III sporulation protein AG [Paenibacillus macerans]MBS5909330.1 stage III sporulation protein AG [Paenibacillus macerans]MDU7472004.1 stage III sporulation protein AG [Paenibacillus macerans]MEC0137023.1 stage III sporulation protein AG [Paenibacillus macerans]MEC0152905.1 stage III sporulation protein AG [Paenibacillus macerans]